jgi:nucleoid DNA-binding protein
VSLQDLAKTLAAKWNVPQSKAQGMLNSLLTELADTLVRDSRVRLGNFGVFQIKVRKARKSRNPRTGARIDVPQRLVATFKPGRDLKDRVAQAPPATEANPAEPPAASAPPPVVAPSPPANTQEEV